MRNPDELTHYLEDTRPRCGFCGGGLLVRLRDKEIVLEYAKPERAKWELRRCVDCGRMQEYVRRRHQFRKARR